MCYDVSMNKAKTANKERYVKDSSVEAARPQKSKRVCYYDALNVLAILCVLALHHNGIVHNDALVHERPWATSLIVECVCYFAVPLFFMLSGATLMNYRKKYDTKMFFKKRVTKLLIPFIVWAAIMFIWQIYILKSIDAPRNIVELLNDFFSNQEQSIYYFMFNMLGMYLTMPLLSLLADKKYEKPLWLTVLLFFVFNGLLPNVLALFGVQYNGTFSVQIGAYVVFVLLGWLLSNRELTKHQKTILYLGTAIGLVYRYLTTFILSRNAGLVVRTTWGYSAWHSILLAAAVFVFVKDLKLDERLSDKSKRVLATLSSCSFGIYLMHEIIMHYEIGVFDLNVNSWVYRTLFIFVTYSISVLAVLIMKKIPVLRRIVP